MGWISPNKALLMGEHSPSKTSLSEEDVSWLASIMFIFAPIGVFLYGVAADKFGRKKALLCVSVPIALGWAVKLISMQPLALIGARALIGFGSGGGFVVCPLYVKEISEDSIRGMTGTFEAAKVLGWLRSLPADDKLISAAVDSLIIEQATCEPKFSPKLLCKFTFRLNLTREFGGCIAVLVYASQIFTEASKDPNTSIALSPNKQSILLATVQIIGSFPLLAITSLFGGFAMCLLAVWFYLQSIGVDMPGWVPITALCVCIFTDASGMQPLPFVIMTEMFNFQII
ncbi:Sugar transporter [Operophtera brumata]|uniref:Sugar transporter n=1 Tax=Operophtera brumata TaxID=104452 RepID=A0A0L7LUV6_OPEBR|nr:Sugar transporter [Operophtera brumata]